MGYSLSLTWKRPSAKTRSASTRRKRARAPGRKSWLLEALGDMPIHTKFAMLTAWLDMGTINRAEFDAALEHPLV
jgi:hypothetical protein